MNSASKLQHLQNPRSAVVTQCTGSDHLAGRNVRQRKHNQLGREIVHRLLAACKLLSRPLRAENLSLHRGSQALPSGRQPRSTDGRFFVRVYRIFPAPLPSSASSSPTPSLPRSPRLPFPPVSSPFLSIPQSRLLPPSLSPPRPLPRVIRTHTHTCIATYILISTCMDGRMVVRTLQHICVYMGGSQCIHEVHMKGKHSSS